MDLLKRRQTMQLIETEPLVPVFYDYLYFDGTGYIDTDIQAAQDESYRFTLGMERLTSTQKIFSFTDTDRYIRAITENSNTSSTNRVYSVYYDSSSSSALLSDKSLSQHVPFTSFFLTPLNFGIASNVYSFTKGDTCPDGTLVIGSNSTHNGQSFTGAMGQFRIYGSDAQNCTVSSDFNNYTPIKTLCPCSYGNRDGLWNVEDGKFYGNTAGSGTLKACHRLTADASSIDTINSTYFRIDNLSRAYAAYDSTNYATIIPTKGSQVESYIYFKFDTSSIPADATIIAVSCSVKVYASTSSNVYLPTRQVQMFSGTTAKGTAQNFSTTAVTRKFYGVTWTRAELENACVRMYLKRGTGNVNAEGYTARFYGATLNVLYK